MRWVFLLCACGIALLAGLVHAGGMTVLHYQDQDPGDPPTQTRILVTADFLRMDAGEDVGDFVLLDRRARTVFNVMRDNQLAMTFVPGTLPLRPATYASRLIQKPGLKQTREFSMQLNGQTCSEGRADSRLAPDAARAMAELKVVMAATQYRVLRDTPAEMRHECDFATQVWDADTPLSLGVTREERDFSGRSRQLLRHERVPLRADLFQLPRGVIVRPAPSL